MPSTPPIAFVPRPAAPGHEPKRGLFGALLAMCGLDARGRAERRALRSIASRYRFRGEDPDAEMAAAWAHYDRRLVAEGLDPAHYEARIGEAIQDTYDWSFDLGRYAPRTYEESEKPKPRPGSPEAMRHEAEQCFMMTGIYGLPSYGGHILTKEERRELGLYDYRLGD